MNQGKCTNLPSECEKAATQELQMMPTLDTRCSECGSLLTRTDETSNEKSNTLKYIIIALILALLLALIAFLTYRHFKNKVKDALDIDMPTVDVSVTTPQLPTPVPAPSVPATNQAPSNAATDNVNKIALDVRGSNTIGSQLMPELLDAYYTQAGNSFEDTVDIGLDERKLIFTDKKDEVFAINLASHGSSTGFKALAAGESDVAMSSRKITPEEVRLLQDKGLGNMEDASQEFVIGIDGIAVIVHPSNPIDKISVADLRKVFSGEVTNWSELGGADQNINLYVRDENSGTKDTFNALVMRDAQAANAQAFEDSNKLSSSVSADVGGIGYIGLPYVNSAKALPVSDGGATALKPSSFTLSTEDYPLTRRLYLYIPANATAEARELANFAVSPEGQQIVEQTGFIGQKAEAEKVAVNEDIPEVAKSNVGYRSLFENAERINTNFRFDFNSSKLDNKAKQDLQRVTELLKTKNKQGENYRLVLVGFTDNKGADCINNGVALDRARIVANELATYGVKADIVEGMGSEAPVADNATELGREKNRRVELWLAPLTELPRFPVKQVCQ